MDSTGAYPCGCGMDNSKDGEYVKFEEAVEASSNSTQQLKAKIALCCSSLEAIAESLNVSTMDRVINELRQLSAV
jgi:hypothetical protein